jgi:hypothetical protein
VLQRRNQKKGLTTMNKIQAKQIKAELIHLGFHVEIESFIVFEPEKKEWHNVKASTTHASIFFVSFEEAQGFIRGVEYTIQNLAKPKLF